MATRRAFQRNIRDKDLLVTRALPGAASTTVTSAVLDLDPLTPQGEHPSGVELCARVPVLNTTQLPDTRTVTLTIESSDDVAFGSGVDTLGTLVVTGAGGVGAAAAELRANVNSFNKRYARLKAVTGASTGDQSGATADLAVVI